MKIKIDGHLFTKGECEAKIKAIMDRIPAVAGDYSLTLDEQDLVHQYVMHGARHDLLGSDIGLRWWKKEVQYPLTWVLLFHREDGRSETVSYRKLLDPPEKLEEKSKTELMRFLIRDQMRAPKGLVYDHVAPVTFRFLQELFAWRERDEEEIRQHWSPFHRRLADLQAVSPEENLRRNGAWRSTKLL